MAPIPYHLVLSIIVGLSVIILCNSAILKQDLQQSDTSNTNPNTPKYDRTCDDPHAPSTTPLKCDYFVLFGNLSDGDEQLFTSYNPRPLGANSRIIIEIPEPYTKDDSSISYISVSYSRNGKFDNDADDVVSIMEGGIGKKSAKIAIEPKSDHQTVYATAVYVKSNDKKNNY